MRFAIARGAYVGVGAAVWHCTLASVPGDANWALSEWKARVGRRLTYRWVFLGAGVERCHLVWDWALASA